MNENEINSKEEAERWKNKVMERLANGEDVGLIAFEFTTVVSTALGKALMDIDARLKVLEDERTSRK